MTVPEQSIHYVEIVTPDPEAVRMVYEKCCGLTFNPKDPVPGDACVGSLPSGLMCGHPWTW